MTEKKPLETTSLPTPSTSENGGVDDAGVEVEPSAQKKKRRIKRQQPPSKDEESDSGEDLLSMRCGDSCDTKKAVGHLLKDVSSNQITTCKESHLYTVYDTHLEQVVPIVERYFGKSGTRLDPALCIRNALKISKREYACPSTGDKLFSHFLPFSRYLEKLKDLALSSARDRSLKTRGNRFIMYFKDLFGFGNQENASLAKKQIQDDGAAKPHQHLFDTLAAITTTLSQNNMINAVEFLPCAELSSMFVRTFDYLRVNGAFRRSKAFKQALCSILKLKFFVAKLLKLQDGLNERNTSKAELNRYRYKFFRARFFETLKEFNFSCLACIESIDPEYISLNPRNRQCVYATLSAFRCLNSLLKLMTTLHNLSSSVPSSLHTVEKDVVFASSNLLLYSLCDVRDASIPELLSDSSVSSHVTNMLPSFLSYRIKSYEQVFGGEFRSENTILGSLLPQSTAEHKYRMGKLESELEKKIVAAWKYERETRTHKKLDRTAKSCGNTRMNFRLVDYICELVLELTGCNITYIGGENGISSDNLQALLQHAFESPEHNEIRGLLFAGPVLMDVFEKIDNDYCSRVSRPFKRLSIYDKSYGDLLERLKTEESFFMSLNPFHINSLLVKRSVLESQYSLLRNAVYVAAVFVLVLSAIFYLCLGKGSNRSGSRT